MRLLTKSKQDIPYEQVIISIRDDTTYKQKWEEVKMPDYYRDRDGSPIYNTHNYLVDVYDDDGNKIIDTAKFTVIAESVHSEKVYYLNSYTTLGEAEILKLNILEAYHQGISVFPVYDEE